MFAYLPTIPNNYEHTTYGWEAWKEKSCKERVTSVALIVVVLFVATGFSVLIVIVPKWNDRKCHATRRIYLSSKGCG